MSSTKVSDDEDRECRFKSHFSISHKLIQFNINQSSMTSVDHILYVMNPDGYWYKNSEQDLCHINHVSETLV